VILWMHAPVTLFICGVRVLWNKMWWNGGWTNWRV
jgi:hypothetical protein